MAQRTALIGGGSQGLGFGCAQALSEAGVRVMLCARRQKELEEAAEKLRAEGAEVLTFACDWSKKEDLEALEEFLKRENLHIDILVNNVGGPPPGLVTQTSETAWERGLDLLFRSTIRLYAMLLPGMRARKWGRIINILSTTATEPSPTLAVSSVIRAGLVSYARLTALEVRKDGVSVNSVMPSGFLTARTQELMEDQARREGKNVENVREQIEATLPGGRFMQPIELGRVVTELAADGASDRTGGLIPVGGK
jgi:3-oxoacyl-[acyl-carrier protein] reductase